MQRVIGIGETVLDIPLPHITADDIVLFGSFFAINPVIRPVTRKLLTEAHEAGAKTSANRLATTSATHSSHN